MSTEITITDNVKHIKIGLTLTSSRPFTKIKREKNTNVRFNNKKTNCHSLIKKTLQNAINTTGTEKKNKCGLRADLSIEKKSNKLKFNLIKSSAHLENLSESEDMLYPEFKL